MLKTKIISLFLLAVIVVCLPVVASAYSVYPYTDFVSESGVDVDGNYVILTFDPNAAWIGVRDVTSGVDAYTGNGASGSWYATAGHAYYCDMYPLGRGADGISNFMNISDDVPNGSKLTLTFSCDLRPGHETPTHDFFICYLNPAGGLEEKVQKSVGVTNVGEEYTVEFTLDRPTSATWMLFYVQLDNWAALYDGVYNLKLTSCRMKISIDSLYALQQQTGKTNQLLTEVKEQLAENGQTLEDILQKQEELPGQIGDQMQGIIDNEKDEAQGEGNKFVDQILDALPDPSTQVLASLKSLTDATSYTGVDAKLQIPALVMPAVGSLIPETVLWSGAEFDMGSYMDLLPETLVTVVQSLFTIAIVLYCVYELIGLISFCLTLRGGGVNG